MPEQPTPNMTPADALVCNDDLQAMKACIPFLGLKEQSFLLAFTKFMEFKRSLSLIREDSGQLTACSVEPALRTPVHMLNSIKAYCSENQRHSIDSLLNCLQIIQMLQMFQGPGTSDSSGAASAADSMDYLKGMLSPEQQQMFQQFSETVQKENSPGGDRHGE